MRAWVEEPLAERPRILIFEAPGLKAGTPLERCEPDCDIVRVDNVAQGLALLRAERFDGVSSACGTAASFKSRQSCLGRQAHSAHDAMESERAA